MSTERDTARLRLAAGDLLDRGLIAREDDLDRADVRIDGEGYRYLHRFWTGTGVLEADGPAWRLRVGPADREAARVRVGAEWVFAGAPVEWARTESLAALALVLARYGAGGAA